MRNQQGDVDKVILTKECKMDEVGQLSMKEDHLWSVEVIGGSTSVEG